MTARLSTNTALELDIFMQHPDYQKWALAKLNEPLRNDLLDRIRDKNLNPIEQTKVRFYLDKYNITLPNGELKPFEFVQSIISQKDANLSSQIKRWQTGLTFEDLYPDPDTTVVRTVTKEQIAESPITSYEVLLQNLTNIYKIITKQGGIRSLLGTRPPDEIADEHKWAVSKILEEYFIGSEHLTGYLLVTTDEDDKDPKFGPQERKKVLEVLIPLLKKRDADKPMLLGFDNVGFTDDELQQIRDACSHIKQFELLIDNYLHLSED